MSEERAFRRLVHTFAASFVGFYLIPVGARLPWKVLGVALVAAAAGFETARLTGMLPWERVYAMRGYERWRPGSYLYFGAGTLPLILWAPEMVTIPCLLCAAIGDPVIGEVRMHAGPWAAGAVGWTLGTAFFAIVGLPAWIAVLTAGTFVAAEAFKNPWLDDDLLTQVVPALVLAALIVAGTWTPTRVVQPLPI